MKISLLIAAVFIERFDWRIDPFEVSVLHDLRDKFVINSMLMDFELVDIVGQIL